MSLESDTRDKVIALGVKVENIENKVESMDEKLTQLHEILVAARGARWGIVGAASVGGFVLAKASTLLPWITSIPPK